MLEDVTTITKIIFDKFITNNKAVKNPKSVYDTYRLLETLIDDIDTLSVHYLTLDLKMDWQDGRSLEERGDKWREVFNRDLERLNKSVQKYLLKLDNISAKKSEGFGSYMTELYGAKVFYGCVRDYYNVGFIEPCSFNLITNSLSIKFDTKSFHILEFNKRDLSTHKDRVLLQTELNEKNQTLMSELKRLKGYILKKYTLEDLL